MQPQLPAPPAPVFPKPTRLNDRRQLFAVDGLDCFHARPRIAQRAIGFAVLRCSFAVEPALALVAFHCFTIPRYRIARRGIADPPGQQGRRAMPARDRQTVASMIDTKSTRRASAPGTVFCHRKRRNESPDFAG
jgi:hypothetical protein